MTAATGSVAVTGPVRRAVRRMTLYSRLMLVVSLALAAVLAAEVLVMQAQPGTNGPLEAALDGDAGSTGSVPPAAGPAPDAPMAPLASYRELAARPLFTDTRRPPPRPEAAPAAAQPDPARNWKLTGVVVAGDASHAFVQNLRDRRVERIEVGMPLDGWRLAAIEPDHALFESGGRQVRLELREEGR